MDVEHHLIKTNGITLHVAAAGPEDGQLVILLHGFPEFWYGWRHQIPALAAAGYRVVAPDQRGYNESDKPAGIRNYATPEEVADVVGLIQAFGREKAVVIGHDFGANVAWWTALTHPHMVEKLGILNVPHPKVFFETLRRSPRQLLKSWYIFGIQIPRLPEASLSRNNFAGMLRAFTQSAKPDTFTSDDLEKYREAWRREGALTAMLNWYRAAMRHQPPNPASWRLAMPALMIWGANDIALSASMAQPSIDQCDNGRLVIIDDATHWVQHDASERVNALLLEFLAQR